MVRHTAQLMSNWARTRPEAKGRMGVGAAILRPAQKKISIPPLPGCTCHTEALLCGAAEVMKKVPPAADLEINIPHQLLVTTFETLGRIAAGSSGGPGARHEPIAVEKGLQFLEARVFGGADGSGWANTQKQKKGKRAIQVFADELRKRRGKTEFTFLVDCGRFMSRENADMAPAAYVAKQRVLAVERGSYVMHRGTSDSDDLLEVRFGCVIDARRKEGKLMMERFRDYSVTEVENLVRWAEELDAWRAATNGGSGATKGALALFKPANLAGANPGLFWGLVRHAQSVLIAGCLSRVADHDGTVITEAAKARTEALFRKVGWSSSETAIGSAAECRGTLAAKQGAPPASEKLLRGIWRSLVRRADALGAFELDDPKKEATDEELAQTLQKIVAHPKPMAKVGSRDPEFPGSSGATTDLATKLFFCALLQGLRHSETDAGKGTTCHPLLFEGDRGSAFSTRVSKGLSGKLLDSSSTSKGPGFSQERNSGANGETSAKERNAERTPENEAKLQDVATGTKRLCWGCGNVFERPERALLMKGVRGAAAPWWGSVNLQSGAAAVCCKDCGLAWYCNADCMYSHRIQHLTEECGGRLRRGDSESATLEPDVEPERGMPHNPISSAELVECVVLPADAEQKPYSRMIPKDPVRAGARLRQLLGCDGVRDGGKLLSGCDGNFCESELLFTRPERGFQSGGQVNDVGVFREGLWLVQRNWPKQMRGSVSVVPSEALSSTSLPCAGGFVRVRDLATAEGKKLNGKIGRLTGEYSADSGRFQVEFEWQKASRNAQHASESAGSRHGARADDFQFDKDFATTREGHMVNLEGLRRHGGMEERRVRGMELMVTTTLKVIEERRDKTMLKEMWNAVANPALRTSGALDVVTDKCCGGTVKAHAIAALADLAERPPALEREALGRGLIRKLLKGANLELVECDATGKVIRESAVSGESTEEILRRLGVPEANLRASCIMTALDLQNEDRMNWFQIGNANLGARARGDVIALRYDPTHLPQSMRKPQQAETFARGNDLFQLASYEAKLKNELTHIIDPELADFTYRMYQLHWGIFSVLPIPQAGQKAMGVAGSAVAMGTVRPELPGDGEELQERIQRLVFGSLSEESDGDDYVEYMAILREEWGSVLRQLPGAESMVARAAVMSLLGLGSARVGSKIDARMRRAQRRNALMIEEEALKRAGKASGGGGLFGVVRQLAGCYCDNMLAAGKLDPHGSGTLAQAMDQAVSALEKTTNVEIATQLKDALTTCDQAKIRDTVARCCASDPAVQSVTSLGPPLFDEDPDGLRANRAAASRLSSKAREAEAKKLVGALVTLHSLNAGQHNAKIGVVTGVAAGGERLEVAVEENSGASASTATARVGEFGSKRSTLRVKFTNLSLDLQRGPHGAPALDPSAVAAAAMLGVLVPEHVGRVGERDGREKEQQGEEGASSTTATSDASIASTPSEKNKCRAEIDDELRISILKAASVILRNSVSQRLPVSQLVQRLRQEESALMDAVEGLVFVTDGQTTGSGGVSKEHWLVKLLVDGGGSSALESEHATYTHAGMCVAVGEGGLSFHYDDADNTVGLGAVAAAAAEEPGAETCEGTGEVEPGAEPALFDVCGAFRRE